MRRFFMGALVLFACGKVAEVPDASPIDGPLDAFSCAAPMLACAAACVDPMTDTKNCGGCGITCLSGVEQCQAGVCIDTAMTCADVAADPDATDGSWTLLDGTVLNCDVSGGTCAEMLAKNQSLPNGTFTKTDGTTIDCDMQDGGLQIIGLGFGAYNAVTPGYALISLADFQNPVLQQFFVKYYNAQGGMALIAGFQSGDCCFRYDQSTGSNTLQLGTSYVLPATTAGVEQCNVVPAAYGALETLELSATGVVLPPMGSDFFTTNAPGTATTCGVPSTNPGAFWTVMQ
jgi:hypothetical protein